VETRISKCSKVHGGLSHESEVISRLEDRYIVGTVPLRVPIAMLIAF